MKNRSLCHGLLAILTSFVTTTATQAGTPVSGFTENTFATSPNLTFATSLAWAPDGSNRLFITRKNGEIRIIKNGALLSTPFATVSPIFTTGECGIQSLCFDPN